MPTVGVVVVWVGGCLNRILLFELIIFGWCVEEFLAYPNTFRCWYIVVVVIRVLRATLAKSRTIADDLIVVNIRCEQRC